ncbi:MAG TPA: PhzF family phenazine biosynthesis protein [Candidatus Limnocylindrales bacterium]|nr:PhzF family phenazine biosynthesis protein [Candidatus Limnocylindrales bacterium]
MDATQLTYHHVDVFAPSPFSGNSLAVFLNEGSLHGNQMFRITQEMRHFESIFLSPTGEPDTFDAKVFDLIEELDFAGHPLLGAAGVLHFCLSTSEEMEWTIRLRAKTVKVKTERKGNGLRALLDQGRPEFLGEVPFARRKEFASALNLSADQLSNGLPLEVVSTGLRYLIVPVEGNLEQARIVRRDFEKLLQSVNAQFAYLLDVQALEGRHWNNDGVMEDIATGSGAGTAGAYLAKHSRVPMGKEFTLRQGRFLGRPSEIRVRSEGTQTEIARVLVGGDVAFVGRGILDAVPEANI